MELLEQIPIWYPLLTFFVGLALGMIICVRLDR